MAIAFTLISKTSTSLTVKAQSNYFGADLISWYINGVNHKNLTMIDPDHDGYYESTTTFDDLDPDTTHEISARTMKSPNLFTILEDNYIYYKTDIPLPGLPTSINTYVSGKNITVTFTKGSYAAGTQIDKYWIVGSPDDTTLGTSFSFTVPDYNTSYTYDLRSTNSKGNSSWTSPITFTSGFPGRPTNFTWLVPKVSGQDFNVYASEWNDLTDRIESFRSYKGLSAYWFTTVYTGSDFAAWVFNQTVYGIGEMSPPSSPPFTKGSGDDVYAAHINQLVDALNSIP